MELNESRNRHSLLRIVVGVVGAIVVACVSLYGAAWGFSMTGQHVANYQEVFMEDHSQDFAGSTSQGTLSASTSGVTSLTISSDAADFRVVFVDPRNGGDSATLTVKDTDGEWTMRRDGTVLSVESPYVENGADAASTSESAVAVDPTPDAASAAPEAIATAPDTSVSPSGGPTLPPASPATVSPTSPAPANPTPSPTASPTASPVGKGTVTLTIPVEDGFLWDSADFTVLAGNFQSQGSYNSLSLNLLGGHATLYGDAQELLFIGYGGDAEFALAQVGAADLTLNGAGQVRGVFSEYPPTFTNVSVVGGALDLTYPSNASYNVSVQSGFGIVDNQLGLTEAGDFRIEGSVMKGSLTLRQG